MAQDGSCILKEAAIAIANIVYKGAKVAYASLMFTLYYSHVLDYGVALQL